MAKTLYFPVTEVAGDIQIDWGDGVIETFTKADIEALTGNYTTPSHEYEDGEATYTVRVHGPIVAFDSWLDAPVSIPGPEGEFELDIFEPTYSQCPITEVVSFGDSETLERVSFNCAGEWLQTVPSTLPPYVINLSHLFDGCSGVNQAALSTWDVSNVKSMRATFNNVDILSNNINNWDTSSVEDMSLMFSGVAVFQADLGNWDVSSVRLMTSMFESVGRDDPGNAFQLSSGTLNWDTSNVLSMEYMFAQSMLSQATLPFDVSNVRLFSRMFAYAPLFNADITGWNTQSAIDMSEMFMYYEAYYVSPWGPEEFIEAPFNQDLSNWNVSSVENMHAMFAYQLNFESDLSGWCVTNIPTRPAVFSGPGIESVVEPEWGTCPDPLPPA